MAAAEYVKGDDVILLRRIFLMAVVVISMLAASATAFASSFFRDFDPYCAERVGFGVVIDQTNLNVRGGPGTQYNILEEVPYGAIMWMPNRELEYEPEKKWVQVCTDDGVRGYVSANLLKPVDVYWQPGKGGPMGEINADGCNLRKGASTKCTIVGSVNRYMNVMVMASANGWYYVAVTDAIERHGWIYGDYVNIVNHADRALRLNEMN